MRIRNRRFAAVLAGLWLVLALGCGGSGGVEKPDKFDPMPAKDPAEDLKPGAKPNVSK